MKKVLVIFCLPLGVFFPQAVPSAPTFNVVYGESQVLGNAGVKSVNLVHETPRLLVSPP